MADQQPTGRVTAFINSTIRLFHWLFLVFAAFAFLVLAIYFIWAIYHSTRGVTTSDIESVQKSLQKVDTSLQADDAETLKSFRTSRDDLQTNLESLSRQTNAADPARKDALDNLNKVALALSRLQLQLSNQREERQAVIKDAQLKLETLRKGIEPTATPEKIAGMAITRAINLVIQLAWPLVVFAVFLYLFTAKRAPDRVKEIFSNFKSVELFSAKFEMGERIKFSAEENFENFRKQAKNSFDHWVQKKGLDGKVRTLLDDPEIQAAIIKSRKALDPAKTSLPNYRCTVHVPDLLFAETFYQLLNYIPRQSGPETKGRIWSFRFGFIGKLWRSAKESDIKADVPTDTEELINDWCMTKEEAESAGSGRKSFLGVMLVEKGVQVGLFYMDSQETNAFGLDNDEALRNLIKAKCGTLEITKALADIAEELRGSAALIRIYS